MKINKFPDNLKMIRKQSQLSQEELGKKINVSKQTVSKYENKIFPGTLVYEQDISNLEKEELLSKLNKIEKNIEDKKVQININNKRYNIQIKNLVSKYNNEKLYKNIIKILLIYLIFKYFQKIKSKNVYFCKE